MYAELTVRGPTYGTSPIPARGSKDGVMVTMDAHARYMQALLDGRCWMAANAAATPVTTQAGLSATTPAFALYNPAGSNTILFVIKFGFVYTTAPAALTVACLATNTPIAAAPTSVTLAPSYCNALTGAVSGSVGQPYVVSTLTAAPVARYYMPAAGAASEITPVSGDYLMDGIIAVYPGVCLSFQTLAAAAVLCHCIWEEVPLSMAT